MRLGNCRLMTLWERGWGYQSHCRSRRSQTWRRFDHAAAANAARAREYILQRKCYASWAHGVTAVSENRNLPVVRAGYGATFTLPKNGGEWIHFPIPTPTLLENSRAFLERVIVLFEARQTSELKRIHVWDGGKILARHDELSVKGNNLGIGAANAIPVKQKDLLTAIVVSAFFAAGANQSELYVPAFGGDFYHDINA
ncbi:DUF6623 family protein [Nonomuraea sp. NPDC050540]|uniref:DUF6623 family protein n=1 Tax=Nonomuraea sp. NPDC050540 TaxID=3364367 RepID=UPI0037A25757